MAEYVENPDKLKLALSAAGEVTISLDCFNGTITSVSYKDHAGARVTIECGESGSIGSGQDLKGKNIEFFGSSGNPDGGKIKSKHTIKQAGGASINYTFPDDYTGTPAIDGSDDQPAYVFTVNFV